MTICGQCQADNRAIARFCKRCGESIVAARSNDQLLGALVGLDAVRASLRDWQGTVEGMRDSGSDPRQAATTLIIGDSGTAKSQLGALIAQMLVNLKVTTKPHPVVVDAMQVEELDPKRLQQHFETARGGVLFVDNVQSLVTAAGDPLPPLKQLMHLVENSPVDPVVVLAGLPAGLQNLVERPEHRNLVARLRRIFRIPDYPAEQLAEIAVDDLRKKGFTVGDDVREKIALRMRWLYRRLKAGDKTIRTVNGWLALAEAEAIAGAYFRRKERDRVLLLADVPEPVDRRKSIDEIMAELDGFIGMDGIKREIRLLHRDIEAARKRREHGIGRADATLAYHFTLTGNPGTGKTTVARALGEVFEALGVLPSGHVVEVERGALVGQFQGTTAPLVHAACDRALGGVLLVDEAYALHQGSGDNFGQEAIDTLLKRMEDDRGKYVVIAAGYRDRIDDFLRTNVGLQSRFTRRFHLDDYTPEELTSIFASLARKDKYQPDDGALAAVRKFFEHRCSRKTEDFANGREARNLLETVLRAQNDRIAHLDEPDVEALARIEAADVPQVGASSDAAIDAAMAEVDALIGMDSIKSELRQLRRDIATQRLRESHGLGGGGAKAYHFVITGNPGTGKTTVARLLGKVLAAMGMLTKGHLVEADRSTLVAGYQGQTAERVADACRRADGGVLFIDEAYALKQSDGDAFGQEAINTLLKRMEDDRGRYVVIAAGYPAEMQAFMRSNQGLPSRFERTFHLDDYKPAELTAILEALAASKDYGMRLDDGARAAVQRFFEHRCSRSGKDFANGREARNLLVEVMRGHGDRMATLQGVPDATTLTTIVAADVPDVGAGAADSLRDAMAELEAMVGLDGVKEAVRNLQSSLARERALGNSKPLGRHFVFTGNPGTGKTTVARILARIFHGLGMLATDRLVEVDRGKLVSPFVGSTAPQTQRACDDALGGVLFIDEAYTLARRAGMNDGTGQEAIDTLLKRMEDDRGKFVVIAAGYTAEMQEFLDSNSGLRSRFTDTIDFADYDGAEMNRIFLALAASQSTRLQDGFEPELRRTLDDLHASRDANFANGRTVRQLFDKVCEAGSRRVDALGLQGEALRDALRELAVADLHAAGLALQSVRGA